MSSLVLSGDTSGTVTLSVPAVAGSNTLTIQAGTGTNSMNTLATAVASTSGTSIDFTSLPSWVKRITVMLAGVSTSGTSIPIIQIGGGSVETSGYSGSVMITVDANVTSGALWAASAISLNKTGSVGATQALQGHVVLTLVSGNLWVISGLYAVTADSRMIQTAGIKTTSATLDRLRITTAGGTDTFDAGSVNILYEG